MELWQRYGTYIASVGMWDIDSGHTHAVENGHTLCGRVPDTSRGAWEKHRGEATARNVDCKRCLASLRKRAA
jgi:hypothetical protein